MLAGLNKQSAIEAANKVLSRKISSAELIQACIDRIEDREHIVRAWKFFDPELALIQAKRCDNTEGEGPLHGVPVGIKDQFDTAEMPTSYGSPIYEGYRPADDAESVARLCAAGTIVMGKTKCTELCTYHPTATTNPLDPNRTPGGSSSGSAAAVADHMVPVATGTQTGRLNNPTGLLLRRVRVQAHVRLHIPCRSPPSVRLTRHRRSLRKNRRRS